MKSSSSIKSRLIKMMIFSFFVLASQFLFSQERVNESFVFIKTEKVSDLKPYISAVENAKWNCYRFMDKRRVLTFDSGLELELFSANEILKKGIVQINLSCIANEEELTTTDYVTYSIAHSGGIIETHERKDSKKQIDWSIK